jgi:tetratricopeptide (TPR) repeat protein
MGLAVPLAAHARVTACDRAAAHPADPDRTAPGVERKAMDLAQAEAACRAAVAADPRDARARYQLGRVLFYQGKAAEAVPQLEAASTTGYRQAIFVLGYVYTTGQSLPRNDCRAAELWQRSIGLDHPWTGYYLVQHYLDGDFERCGLTLSDADLRRYVGLAASTISVADSAGRVERLAARLQQKLAPAVAVTAALGAEKPFEPANYPQTPTECDRLASHPEDPHRVAPGRERPQIDLPAAIAACQAAVKADPTNPRLNYQLGRVLGYSGRGSEALGNRAAAVDANYPQALFVIGYITMLGVNQQPKDVCRGAELIRRSALAGRLAGQLGFPKYVLAGDFDACPVRKDVAEMRGFVAAARQLMKGEYYQTLLADSLEAALAARAELTATP